MALSSTEIAERLGDAPFPPSEKLIGGVLLVAVDRLKGATADLLASSQAMEEKTDKLIGAAWLTLAVALVSVVVAVVATVK